MGSETDLIRRLGGDGLSVWCCESAVVEHLVPSAHLQTDWIMKRAERWGRARARFDRQETPQRPASWFGMPRWIFRAAAAQILTAAGATLVGNSAKAFRARWELNELRGWALEARKEHIEERGRNGAVARHAS